MERPQPKYQVFVSSTFSDLTEERRAVTWAILSLYLFPVGMEVFPAANDRGWKIIKQLIEKTDYYVLIVGGRYGSLDAETDMSWTHREYRFALDLGIPIFPFLRTLRSTTADHTERDPDALRRWNGFIDELGRRHHCKEWETTDQLCQLVVQALSVTIREDEGSDSPRPGWFRGSTIPSTGTMEEFARLSEENQKLRTLLAEAAKDARSARLQLTTNDGSVPDEVPFDVVTPRLNAPGPSWSVSHGGTTYGLTSESVESFIWRHRNTLWLRLAVKNVGDMGAEQITVDLEADWASAVHTTRPVPLIGVHSGEAGPILAEVRSRFEDSSRTTYVDYVHAEEGLVRARFRIQNVPPGGLEFLPEVGFELAHGFSLPADALLRVQYRMFARAGGTADGAISVRVDGAKDLVVDFSNVVQHIDRRNWGYG